MTLKSAWAYHNAGRELRESVKRAKAFRKPRPVVRTKASDSRKARIDTAFNDFWDKLEEGSTLDRIGVCATVAKINGQSLHTTTGAKWTKSELRNLLG